MSSESPRPPLPSTPEFPLKTLTPLLSRTQSSSELFNGKDWPYSRPSTPFLHSTPQLGWIGLGAMGNLMARNLASSSNHPVFVYNRTESKSKALAEANSGRIIVADTIADLVDRCDVIFTNLANDEVVKEVYGTILSHLEAMPPLRNKIFVETSTLDPSTVGELDIKITKIKHAHFVAAPVFGAPAAADKRQLLIVLAGEYKIKKEIAYLVVPVLGRKIIDMGGNVEKAAKLKICGNAMILGQIELLAECMTLADKSEVGAANFFDVIKEIMPSAALIGYGTKILNDQFDGSKGFSLSGGIKDASLIRKLASASNSPIPAIDVAHQHLITARALQSSASATSKPPYENLDWSALVAGVRLGAGLPGFDSSMHGGVQLE